MTNHQLTTPLALLIGSALIAVAILTSPQPITVFGFTITPGNESLPEGVVSLERAENKHLYGSPRAAITIVEFSDYECPFCSQLHPTLKRIVDESDGSINWEFRHLPLPNHRNAFVAALTSECVSDYLGNDAFWEFTNTVFAGNPGTVAFYDETAKKLGLTTETLNTCKNDDRIEERVALDALTADAFGGSGTPHSIIIFPDGSTTPIRGALPYEQWTSVLGLE